MLTSVHLLQFRSHADRVITLNPKVTAIVGPNGSGKTNILEAIYTLYMGKSFRDADDELIAYDYDWYRIQAKIDDIVRELRYQPSNKGKQLLIDGTSKGRFTYRQQLPVVLFEPDDLLMIHGSPGARRRYIDEFQQKLSLPYRQTLSRYERVLTQRNNILKQRLSIHQTKDALFVWDVSLADLGIKIINARKQLITYINEHITQVYSEVAGRPQSVRLSYNAPDYQQSESQFLSALHAQIEIDMRRGFTGVGPHRHDIDIFLNDKPAKHTASRGEVRSIVIGLKQIEMTLIRERIGVPPIFLLDDVFSELDSARQQAVTHYPDTQTVLTTTHLNDVSDDMTVMTLSMER